MTFTDVPLNRHVRTALWITPVARRVESIISHALDTTLLSFPLVNARECYLMLKFDKQFKDDKMAFAAAKDLLGATSLRALECARVKVSLDTLVLRTTFWLHSGLRSVKWNKSNDAHRELATYTLLSATPIDESTANIVVPQPFRALATSAPEVVSATPIDEDRSKANTFAPQPFRGLATIASDGVPTCDFLVTVMKQAGGALVFQGHNYLSPPIIL